MKGVSAKIIVNFKFDKNNDARRKGYVTIKENRLFLTKFCDTLWLFEVGKVSH